MLFRDSDLEQKFITQGFVVLPLLTDKQVAVLKELYASSHSLTLSGLQPTLRIGDAQKNIELHKQIGDILSPVLEKWFHSFEFNANHFISKGAKDANEFSLHQDWNVVDESKYIAAHIWIPLQDTDEHNGGLFVVAGSHKFFNNHRSGSCGIVFIERTEKVKQHITSLSLKAGQAVVYQQALFHGSYPNKGGEARLVCLVSIRPYEAPMKYYHKPEVSGKHLEIYEITPEILFEQISDLEKGIHPYYNNTPDLAFDTQLQQDQAIDTKVFEMKL